MNSFKTISVEEAAERLKVSSEDIDRWIAAGHILIIRGLNNEPLVLAEPFERICQRSIGSTSAADIERIWWHY